MKPFENASQAFKLANPHLLTVHQRRDATQKLRHARGHLNKTEAEYGLKLEAMKRDGEILRYEFEGVTLRWADMRYTPDFIVFPAFPGAPPVMLEVKGGHIRDRDIVRFKGARAWWPEFGFQMYQKKEGTWKRLH